MPVQNGMFSKGVVHNPKLDHQSEVPLYQQLHRYFTDLIHSGSLQRGERLPPTRELAGLLGLNRTTISAAYELLESDGLISGQVGRGSYVTGGNAAPVEGLKWDAILDGSNISPAQPVAAGGAGAISFAVSRPSEDLFPVDDFRASCEEVMAGRGIRRGSATRFAGRIRAAAAVSDGSGAARRRVPAGRRSDGHQRVPAGAWIWSRRVLIRAGDKVAAGRAGLSGAEKPVSGSGRGAHRHSGAARTGWISRSSSARFRRERFKALVVTSNFQNPTGATLPSGRARLGTAPARAARERC